MTRVQLLKNLNEAKILKRMCYRYEVISDTTHQEARRVFIIVFHPNELPLYILEYRLDLNFLVNHYYLGFYPMRANELEAFEKAVLPNKNSRG